ncbi:MAG: orotidine-5'-phosphate decarboxylase [Magnetococcales bacterium]|nr:orotidine-5'-phosphate decarboxylase [Magnetococcales bacterium]
MHHFSDRLIRQARTKNSRLIVGLDPNHSRFPLALRERLGAKVSDKRISKILFEYNRLVIDATADLAVAYKPQVAFYEQYGLGGHDALIKTLAYLRLKGLLSLVDGKRNDIAHTARAYAISWLSPRDVLGRHNPTCGDALTINGYLGSDGVRPFQEINPNAGLFVLGKTSNPSSGELQDLTMADGAMTVYETMAALADIWGSEARGEEGFSNIGLVVGATHDPTIPVAIRKHAPHAPFLMPGIGAQGGSLDCIVSGSNAQGEGAFAASSRGVMYPFDPDASELTGKKWKKRARAMIHTAAEEVVQAVRNRLAQ